MLIKHYTKDDRSALFELIKNEGEEWKDYFGQNQGKYKTALERSITYVAYEGNILCGYCRCRDDDGFGVYIYDLLVDKKYRGKHFGRLLMERVCADFSHDIVYVMSSADNECVK